MKKQVMMLAAILCLATLTTTAQKSTKFVTGTVSYTKSTDVDASYGFSPTIGYYLTNKVSVGVSGEVGKADGATTTNVGVFGRCDFASIGKSCTVFSQADLASNSTTVADVKTTSIAAGLGLGANYAINSKWALTMHVADLISYTSADSKSTLTVGFSGVNNPFATAKFGVMYKF
jgi:outer membrane protein W